MGSRHTVGRVPTPTRVADAVKFVIDGEDSTLADLGRLVRDHFAREKRLQIARPRPTRYAALRKVISKG
jgi:hypothetical protein